MCGGKDLAKSQPISGREMGELLPPLLARQHRIHSRPEAPAQFVRKAGKTRGVDQETAGIEKEPLIQVERSERAAVQVGRACVREVFGE